MVKCNQRLVQMQNMTTRKFSDWKTDAVRKYALQNAIEYNGKGQLEAF